MHQFEVIAIKRAKFLHFNQAARIMPEFNIDAPSISLLIYIYIYLYLSHTYSLSLLQAVTLAELQTRSTLEQVSKKCEKSIESVASVVQSNVT